MKLYGLIGWPLGHSFSEKYFTQKFEELGLANISKYQLFPLENIEKLPHLLKNHPNLRGLNVTIPHKKTVIKYLDALDETASAVGAVNTIRIRDGRLTGFNTDVIGFEKSLTAPPSPPGGGEPIHPHLPSDASGVWYSPPPGGLGGAALILGTGGAAQAVAFVFSKKGWPFKFVSRKKNGPDTLGYADLDEKTMAATSLIVNTTPLGMAPNLDDCPPLPFFLLKKETCVFDLIYNPTETVLLRRAAARGCPTRNGLDMLHQQADAAWEIFK